jgi:CheY-like chemotaxis protein
VQRRSLIESTKNITRLSPKALPRGRRTIYLMGRWENPGLLGVLMSKLGFKQTEASVDGKVQIRLHTGYGLKIRERRVVAPPALVAPENAPRDPPLSRGSNGRLSNHFVDSEAEQSGGSKAISTGVFDPGVFGKDGLGQDAELADHALGAAHSIDAGPEVGSVSPSANVAEGLSALAFAASSYEPIAPDSAGAPDAPDSPEGENTLESSAVPTDLTNRHAALSGKVLGVVGYPPEQAVSLGQSLAAQHSSFVVLTHAEAEFKKGAANACHLLLVSASQDWSNPASLKASWLGKLKKPAIVESDRITLSFLARFPHAGPREFVPGPCPIDELLWRSALLLGRVPTAKTRKSKKRRHPELVIADSDPASLTLVDTVLTLEGFECRVADNGSLALELIKATAPDAVILEVTLPGSDGFQILAEIRRDPALAGMVVILLTSRQAEADVLRGFSLGADDYVTKPFSPLELAARLKRALARAS